MKPGTMLQELESLAERLAVKVSYESLAASIGLGGLCRVKGQYRVIIDKRASVHERVATLAQSLARIDTSRVEVDVRVRRVVDQYARRHAAARQTARRAS
jgi:ketopantoate hydroxymethyltransferase